MCVYVSVKIQMSLLNYIFFYALCYSGYITCILIDHKELSCVLSLKRVCVYASM